MKINTSERENVFAAWIVEQSREAVLPIIRAKLIKDFRELMGNDLCERMYYHRFDNVMTKILESDQPIELKARACFITSYPITHVEFLENLQKAATISLNSDNQLMSYKSKNEPIVEFSGWHRKIYPHGRRVGEDKKEKETKKRDRKSRSRNTMNQGEQEGNGGEKLEGPDNDGDDEVVEEDDDDVEIIMEDADSPPETSQPSNARPTNLPNFPSFQQPSQSFSFYSPEQKPFDYSSFGQGTSMDLKPLASHYQQMTYNSMKPQVKKMRPSEIFETKEPPVFDGANEAETSGRRLSAAPSISSIHNGLPTENHYANFLKGVHFFLQDYSKSLLDLKKMSREAKKNNLGMNITPRTLVSYMDVCLGDVICMELAPASSKDVVNLKEFLDELRNSAEDFGDVLQGKIIRVVDGIMADVKETDKVPLKLVSDAFGRMIRGLKARAERGQHL